ncbi:helix-turn-helix domain-containing protein [Alteromonas confluentis]|uniref:Ner winged helix-turn-helix DNA-binding domain-containing protein n=1 Tax=Alteromonas confluentis TaxID=1656094 RepID=A0A1E7ZE41_9ALTE|nr:helix-turn-helix transcriptional regulator [Alteromonas confluentis]OFC71779.1 hypothetical protein BFC18_06395 [Alteromonas confluentis]
MSNQDWHPADIVAAVRKLGITLKDLSIQNGLPERACQVALHRAYTRPETVIANALGCHPKEIWPSRYHANGERKRFLHSKIVAEKKQRDIKSSPTPAIGETQKCLTANEG